MGRSSRILSVGQTSKSRSIASRAALAGVGPPAQLGSVIRSAPGWSVESTQCW